jgi:hypothetical protein
MNNEPVAWMAGVEGGTMYTNYEYPNSIPLYTHPIKELTDTEIADALYVADITLNNLSDGDIPIERINAFARAILRKAQNKC